MARSRFSGNGKEEVFVVMTKNFKVFVANTKKGIRMWIKQRAIARHNFGLFLCWPDKKNNTIRITTIERPKFYLTKKRLNALSAACVYFLTKQRAQME